jgi:carboxypeptidase C (cathepsin A)
MLLRGVWLRAFVCAMGLLVLGDGTAKADEPKAESPEDKKKKEPPPAVVTQATVTIGGQEVRYTARTGKLPLKDEATGNVKVFFIAYTRDEGRADRDTKDTKPDLSTRPVTFAFNGGPGSSSVWLHMGTMGPRRVTYGVEGEPLPPPAKLVDNEWSWLDVTDLVFIDPVSTGFSRAREGEHAGQFHGLTEDIAAVGEFIRLYCVREGRWASPKFLVGESYGTTRAAGLAGHLQDALGMGVNGIVLVSPVLHFQTLAFDNGNDTPYWLFLPTYTATAWHHGKLKGDWAKTLESAVAEAEKFAGSDYLVALGKGDTLPAAERARVAKRMSELTGVTEDFVKRSNLRLKIGQFTKELLREQGKTVGRFDSRYQGIDRDGVNDTYDYDPSYAAIQSPFTGAFNQYVRGELKYETDLNYEILTGKVQPWNLGANNRYAETAETLRRAMTTNPSLRLMVACGYYDLATPFFAADYTVSHLGLAEPLRGNVETYRYKGGHMMYLRAADLQKLKGDAAGFYQRALKADGAAMFGVGPDKAGERKGATP